MKKIFNEDRDPFKNILFQDQSDQQQQVLSRSSPFKQPFHYENQTLQKKESSPKKKGMKLSYNGEIKWPFFKVMNDPSIRQFWSRRTQKDQNRQWLYNEYAFESIMLRIGKKKKTVKGYYYRLTVNGLLMYFKKESDAYPKGFLELNYLNRVSLLVQRTRKNKEVPVLFIERTQGLGITIFDHQQDQTIRFCEALQNFCLMSGYDRLYTELETLGTGAFATVYKIERNSDGQVFAAKTIYRNKFEESKHKEKFIQMIYNEVITLKSLNHPGIEKIFEIYQERDKLVIIVEFLSGGTLYQYYKHKRKINEKQIAFIMKSICEALLEMHNCGFVHRDIKLDNIMLESKDPLQVKLVDFGFAEKINEKELINKSGTPGFLAPEIFRGEPYTAKGDVFSTGVLLYLITAGYAPFRGKPSQIQNINQKCSFSIDKPPWPDVTQDLRNLVKKMMEVRVEDRYSVSEVLESAFIVHNTKPTSETNYKSFQMVSGLEIERSNKSPFKTHQNSDSAGSFQLDFSFHTNDIKSLYQKNSIKTMTMKSSSKGQQSIKQSYKQRQSISVPKSPMLDQYSIKRKQSHPDHSSQNKDSEDSSFGEIIQLGRIGQSIENIRIFEDTETLSNIEKNFLYRDLFNHTKKP